MQGIKRIYDKKNRLIEESDLNDNDIYFKKFKYDDNDNLIFLEKKNSNFYHFIKEFEYDQNKNITKETYFSINDNTKTFDYAKTFKYNEKGLLIEDSILEYRDYFKNLCHEGTINKYEYDDKDRLIEQHILKNLNSDTKQIDRIVLFNLYENVVIDGVNYVLSTSNMDQKNNSFFIQNNQNNNFKKELHQYDELNRLIKVYDINHLHEKILLKSFEYWNDTNTIKKEFTYGAVKYYNEDGLVNKIINNVHNNNYDIYKYDNDKNLIEIEYYVNNELLTKVENEYDIFNNLSCTTFIKDKNTNSKIIDNKVIYENEYLMNEQELKKDLDEYFDFDR